ncbi:uncharacterized protein LOC135118570 [Helicoverpa armigera]|uniref:uncharacterized protein LOC135118570 n=1 Tax=Helicoverpa armigera TaxID=29058 RepID=UPI003083D7ED
MSTSKADGDSAESCRVGVRVPPFYPEKPALWFAQMDAQFALANIKTDETKYYYVTGHLDPKYADVVEDIITNPPATDKYEKLKAELIKRLSASREEKVKQLLMHEELGDRKPSQFYRHLLNLAGPGVPEEFLRTIWTSRLPAGTQTIVASQSKLDLAELAELADRIHVIAGPAQVASTAAVATAPSSSTSGLHAEIAALNRQMQAMALKIERLSRNRSRSRSRSRHRSSSRRSQCWYHQRFGDNAKKCIKPCDYTTSGNVRGNQ